jgi:hypothetical protein
MDAAIFELDSQNASHHFFTHCNFRSKSLLEKMRTMRMCILRPRASYCLAVSRGQGSRRRIEVLTAPEATDFTWSLKGSDTRHASASSSRESRQLLADFYATDILDALLEQLADDEVVELLQPQSISIALMKISSWALDERDESLPTVLSTHPTLPFAIQVLERELVAKASSFNASSLSDAIWALASISAGMKSNGVDLQFDSGVLSAVNVWFLNSRPKGMVEKVFYMHDLLSLLWGCASLYADLKQEEKAKVVQLEVLNALVLEATDRLQDNVKEVSPGDLVDLISALSLLSSSQDSNATPIQEELALGLLEQLALEITRQLANRHPQNSSYFLSRDLVALMEALRGLSSSSFFRRSVNSGRLLDTIAGYISRAIKSNHYQAMRRPAHIGAVLLSLSLIQHNSVAIPDLLSSLSYSLMLSVAEHNENLADPCDWSEYLSSEDGITILTSWKSLSHDPGPYAISSLRLALEPQLEGMGEEEKRDLESCFANLGYDLSPSS